MVQLFFEIFFYPALKILIFNFWRKGPGEKVYLPKTKEDDPFDAQELGKGFVRFQLFSKHMVEEHKRVQCKWNRDV